MPTFTVQGPDGRTLKIEGPTPPTEAELDEIFASVAQAQPQQPDFRTEVKASDGTVEQTGFLSNLARAVLPSTTLSDYWEGPAYALQHPVESAKLLGGAILGAHAGTAEKAIERGRAAMGGDMLAIPEAVGYGAATLLPVMGPAAAAAGEQIGSGDVTGGLGTATGILAPNVVPAAVRGTSGLRASIGQRMRATNPNAAEQIAVQFGLDRGVPIDAATATGNPAIRGTQFLADRSIVGGAVANRSRQRQANALARVGNELADEANPGGSITPEQAGAGVRGAVEGKLRDFHSEATTQYDTLRQIEADPAHARQVQVGTREVPDHAQTGAIDAQGQPIVNRRMRQEPIMETMALPVDLRGVKAALRPIYERMNRQLPVTIRRSSPGFTAIENIVNGKDFAPLSIADADLSAIKSIARGADLPELRDASQGLAAKAVQQLDEQVRATARGAGPNAIQALQAGRQATTNKYGAADVLKQIREEPVQAFNQTVWAKDAGIDRLRDIAKLAPNELPKVGRAYLEDLLSTATAEGGFSRAQGLHTKWQNLGPQTKALLYPDAKLRQSLDSFFLLAKKISENPNPSGTAFVGALGAQGAYLVTNPLTGVPLVIGAGVLSKMLHSAPVVRLLTQGLRTHAGGRANSALANQIIAASKAVQRGSAGAGRTKVAQDGARQVAEQPPEQQEPERQYAR